MRPTLLSSLAAVTFIATVAYAQEESGPADCSKFKGLKNQEAFKQDPKEVHECMARGWDAPVNWRPNKGKSPGIRVGGAGGFSHGTMAAPDLPPWKSRGDREAAASSSGASGSSSGPAFPPWPGWPGDSSGSSGSGSSGSGSSSSSGGGCPTSNDDTDATFGEKKPLASSQSLTCGGVAPLTTYQLSLSPGADMLLITEAGYFNYWLYKKIGTSYQLVSPTNAMLPNKLCDNTALQPPIAQMIAFPSAAPSVAIRLKQISAPNPLDPPPLPPAVPERHLVLQVSGGTLQTAACADNNIYKVATNIGSIVFDTVLAGGCEAAPSICTANGVSQTPAALPDCRLAILYPPGAGCADKTQYVLLDRPNLVYPPGSATVSVPIDGLTSVMLATVPGSMIQTKDGWVVHLGDPAATFTFPQGATLGLADGNRLVMGGPATVTGTGQVTLTKGGSMQTKGGSLITSYPDGTIISATVFRPMALKINQSVSMPPGFMVPSSPTATVRLPVTIP